MPLSLTPQQEYDIRVTATDLDGIGDLESFYVKFWFDSSGTETTEADYDSYVLTRDLSQHDCAVITWDDAYAGWAYIYAVSTGFACSWALDSDYFNIPTPEQRSNPEYITHEFTYRVKIGKVCRATSGVDIHYISNGNYYQQIKAETVWESQGGSPDAILSAHAAEPNTFAMKALNNIQLNYAVLVDPGGGWVTIPYDIHGQQHGTITAYSGYVVPANTNDSTVYPYPANTLWLKLNPEFAKDTYSGIITYGIVNQT